MKLVVFSYYLGSELLYACCEHKDYEQHGENAAYIEDITKGVSDDQQEAIEDFCVNVFLSSGDEVVVDYDDIEFKAIHIN